ncbi:MAG: hypothetical protein GF329_04415 [Candidatus Lokiarchaeota archaeon]|nr:hypothetical protein [Candidatus Lokiarchaeota archaeon]
MNTKNNKNLFQKYYSYIFLAIIVLVSFIYQLIMIFRFPYSYGVDGAYYDLNVINILETGDMWSQDNPVVFYYFAIWALIIGDVAVSIKIGLITLCSLIPIPIYFIIKKFTENEKIPLFGAFISTFNPLFFRLLGDFVKNAVGVLFLLVFIYIFIITCEKKYSIKKTIPLYLLSYGLFILITFTHIYPTGYAVGVIFLYFIYSILYKLISERKFPWKEFKLVVFLIISCGSTIFIGYLLAPEFFDQFSKIYTFVSSLFNAVPLIFQNLVLKQPPHSKPDLFGIQPVLFIVIVIIMIIGAVIIIIDIIRKRKEPKKLQYIAFLMIVYLPTYLVVPNVFQYPTGFFIERNPIIDLLTLITTFPVSAGIALICYEIYKDNPEKRALNRLKGNLLSIFLMSLVLAMPFISMEWRSRFAYMNFIPISLIIGYGFKKLKLGRKKIAALFLIGFFSVSSLVQTHYFCVYSFRPVLTTKGEEDLLYLKNYVESNSTLEDSMVIIQDLGLYYFTILITDLECKKSGKPDELADQYNETIFEIIPKMGMPFHIEPGMEVIRNESNGQLLIILANYTYHD